MSFRCQHCKESQPTGIRPVRRAVRTRSKDYPMREVAVGVFRRQVDRGGTGYETVKEVVLCPKCALDGNAGRGK